MLMKFGNYKIKNMNKPYIPFLIIHVYLFLENEQDDNLNLRVCMS